MMEYFENIAKFPANKRNSTNTQRPKMKERKREKSGRILNSIKYQRDKKLYYYDAVNSII